MDKTENSLATTSSRTEVAQQTSCVYELSLEDLQILMKKAAKLASLRFIFHMRKEGLL